MTKPWTGGCACGAIRYDVRAEPLAQTHCQCRDCQKRSGTGHASYLVFPQQAAVAGEVSSWRVAGDSGNEKIHTFCPTCGGPLFLTFAAALDIVAVHAGSLDEPDRFTPQLVTYGVRGHAWDTIDPALQVFARMPPG